MRDVQDLMKKFVKMVEKYPEVYDNSLDGYRSQQAEWAWDKIVEQVKADLKEECTVEELKAKWKGIRSSYNRYKNKLYMNTAVCKKYYLYDYLQFLDPFIKPRALLRQEQTSTHKQTSKRESCIIYDDGNENESLNECDPLDDWEVDVKHEFSENVEPEYKLDILEVPSASNNIKKFTGTKSVKTANDCNIVTVNESELSQFNTSDAWDIDIKPNLSQKIEEDHKEHTTEAPIGKNSIRRNISTKNIKSTEENDSDSNEDLQFFKSILSDIKSFTSKEKRKLKMGILQLIDDVENERKRQKLNE